MLLVSNSAVEIMLATVDWALAGDTNLIAFVEHLNADGAYGPLSPEELNKVRANLTSMRNKVLATLALAEFGEEVDLTNCGYCLGERSPCDCTEDCGARPDGTWTGNSHVCWKAPADVRSWSSPASGAQVGSD